MHNILLKKTRLGSSEHIIGSNLPMPSHCTKSNVGPLPWPRKCYILWLHLFSWAHLSSHSVTVPLPHCRLSHTGTHQTRSIQSCSCLKAFAVGGFRAWTSPLPDLHRAPFSQKSAPLSLPHSSLQPGESELACLLLPPSWFSVSPLVCCLSPAPGTVPTVGT